MSEHSCPTCERTFTSRRGLAVHHSQVHDQKLPNRECAHCGVVFYCKHEKKYCSADCRDEAVSYEGESNPNYDGGKAETECEICGASFEYYPSDKEGLYCSECVESEQWRHERDIERENNPRWNGGKTEYECEVCGDTVERYSGRVTGEIVACGEECRREWLSEEFTGDGHPNWEGGDTGSYGKGWSRVRKLALERDGYECTHCGKTKDEIGRNPDVHHIIPVRVFDRARDFTVADAHRIENVVSLCVDCHRKADFGQITKSELASSVSDQAVRADSSGRRARRSEPVR